MKNPLRLFIAIEVSPAILAQLAIIQQELKKTTSGIKWVDPQNMHLTLRFLGNTDENDIAPLKEMIAATALRFYPLTIKLTNVGVFPGFKRPRIIWVGVNDKEAQLVQMMEEFKKLLQGENGKEEGKSIIPHLTIGRAKESTNPEALEKSMKKCAVDGSLEQPVTHLTLFNSELTPQGPIHAVLANFPLKNN